MRARRALARLCGRDARAPTASANLRIPALAGMTGEKAGMTGEKAGMTGEKAGMTGEKTGMTGEKTGMTG